MVNIILLYFKYVRGNKKSKSDIVIGSRFLNNSKLEGLSNERSLGSKIANKMARISLHKKYSNLTDYLSGCFCLEREKTNKLIKKLKLMDLNFYMNYFL